MDLNLSDKEFKKKYADILYKTKGSEYGKYKTKIPEQKIMGINGTFSSKLSKAGMYRNHSLNTHVEPERYFDGSKDWMEYLN